MPLKKWEDLAFFKLKMYGRGGLFECFGGFVVFLVVLGLMPSFLLLAVRHFPSSLFYQQLAQPKKELTISLDGILFFFRKNFCIEKPSCGSDQN